MSLAPAPGGSAHIPFEAPAGLFRFSVVLDARGFVWERLYVDLHRFGNRGQRTGPWDFSIIDCTPVVPAYRVYLDGHKLGLWYMQRISLEDLEARRFRGHFAFRLDRPGEHELRLIPYRPDPVTWTEARLEPDPEDRLAPVPQNLRPAAGNVPVSAWRDPAFWERQRQRRATTHRVYRELLESAFDWVADPAAGISPETPESAFAWGSKRETALIEDVPLLLAAHYLDGRSGMMGRALDLIDETIMLPAWGPPQEDVYSHNGDMYTMLVVRAMCRAWHMIGEDMGGDRRKRLEEKIRFQGNIFLEQILLQRDYWGGSVVQDHGWKSVFGFADAALHMYGILPEADHWLEYILPRVRRSLDAMPPEGVVPASSHLRLWLYVDDLTAFRDTLLALSGEDIFNHPPLHLIVEYMAGSLDRSRRRVLTAGNPFCGLQPIGSYSFFNIMAAKFDDPIAAALHNAWLAYRPTAFIHTYEKQGYYHGLLWGFLSYDGRDRAARKPLRPPRRLKHYADACVVQYYDDENDAGLALHCGPTSGHHSWNASDNPCDHTFIEPAPGHFCLYLRGEPVLGKPHNSYRISADLFTTLLIDGETATGCIGYPMSIPNWTQRGEKIESVDWDEARESGRVRLDLQPAYAPALGLESYTRELLLPKERAIHCRDHVRCDRPRRFAWLFQVPVGRALRIDSDGAAHGEISGGTFVLRPDPGAPRLSASLHPSEVVHGYASRKETDEYLHVRFETVETHREVDIRFTLCWEASAR